jgi:hypothetical protein
MFLGKIGENSRTLKLTSGVRKAGSLTLKRKYDLSFVLLLGLLDLANSYCEQQLKKRCERIIKQGISVENVAMLYATAIKYQVREKHLSRQRGHALYHCH